MSAPDLLHKTVWLWKLRLDCAYHYYATAPSGDAEQPAEPAGIEFVSIKQGEKEILNELSNWALDQIVKELMGDLK